MKKKNQDNGTTDFNDLVTPTEAARIRGVTRAAITALVKRGRLQTVEVGGRSFIRRSEIENFEAEKPGPKVA
jgi:excisionase family DNA binding protein